MMDIKEGNILKVLLSKPFVNQRTLSQDCGYSLGVVNAALKRLQTKGYLDETLVPTEKARMTAADTSPKNAIILAAGYGMRMVPINMDLPKGLLEVKGESLIERLIRQLQEAGVSEIYVVVGFMKERFEYLIDEYGVELIVNPEYASKNNLHSLKRALRHVSNSYIIPCDLWCRENPFSPHELHSWYMISEQRDPDSPVRVNRREEVTAVKDAAQGNKMVGISYLAEPQAKAVREKAAKLCEDPRYEDAFWEEALYDRDRMIVPAKIAASEDVVEINTYEQLRELDYSSAQLRTEAITTIARAMEVSPGEITDIEVLKKGMTNRSFLFSCKGEQYIMRIPGEGTDKLIDREKEVRVYSQLTGRNICDDIFYINPRNGYKITKYFENARVCDPSVEPDLQKCMQKLREFHSLGLQVEHEFNIFGQIDFYESLWQGEKSVFRDYRRTKENVLSLKAYIDRHKLPYVLTHIDAVPDNFLFINDASGTRQVRLIDWEYAGMQDPHVDIAMFCIYSMYDRTQIDHLIDLYFENACSWENRIKIYCYIACCGLLWSNWCEYKRLLGIEFGEYSLKQYRYAKEYFKIVQRELMEKGCGADA